MALCDTILIDITTITNNIQYTKLEEKQKKVYFSRYFNYLTLKISNKVNQTRLEKVVATKSNNTLLQEPLDNLSGKVINASQKLLEEGITLEKICEYRQSKTSNFLKRKKQSNTKLKL